MIKESLTLIGRAEKVTFPDYGFKDVPAKIDTGADASSIWGTAQVHEAGHLEVIFFGPASEFYDGKVYHFEKEYFNITRVASSFGHREIRYKVKLSVRVHDRLINGTFTLADRSGKIYPVLLGRKLLHNKFIVDVSAGEPLIAEERKRKRKLHQEILDGELEP